MTVVKIQEEGREEIEVEETEGEGEAEEGRLIKMVMALRVEEGMVGKVDNREIWLIMVMESEVKGAKNPAALQTSQEKYTFHQNLLMMTPCLPGVLVLV
jgi:hypothetical protein